AKAFELVHRYADQAMALDKNVAESHVAKASAYLFYEWKWKKAYDALQNAIRLNPAVTSAYQLQAFYYILAGQKEKAIQTMEEAVRLDPLSPIMNHHLGNTYVFAERYDDAIRQADKLLEIDPQMRIAIELKAWATGMKNEWPQALKLFEEVHRLTRHPLKGLMGIGYAAARLGDKERALDCIRKIEQRQAEDPDSVVDADLAGIWFALGDMDKVFYHINQCVQKRIAPVDFFLEYPVFQELRKDPRFAELKKKTGVEHI
ncbi:MAG: tetratricopeptide repeat protein, partial [Bacteroidota bacterium]